jgi:hypothetical protein
VSGKYSTDPAIVVNHCRGLYDRTRALWNSLEGRYPTWPCRFSILYGPPIHEPDLLILGSNPGFNPRYLYDEEILTWPKANEYATQDWPLAAKLRRLFAAAGLESILEHSVGTNRLFFKSKCLGKHETGLGWGNNPSEIRDQLESFCDREINELIQMLKPKVIFVLGLAVFDAFADRVLYTVSGAKGRRVAAVGLCGDSKVIGIIHPTGAQVSSQDWAAVSQTMATEFEGSPRRESGVGTNEQPFAALDDTQSQPVRMTKIARNTALGPATVVKAATRPPSTFAYQPIHDFWRELARLGEVTIEEFHQHMVSTGWRRPRGGLLTYPVTRTDLACMCRNGFAVRVRD